MATRRSEGRADTTTGVAKGADCLCYKLPICTRHKPEFASAIESSADSPSHSALKQNTHTHKPHHSKASSIKQLSPQKTTYC